MIANSYPPTPASCIMVDPGEYWEVIYRSDGFLNVFPSGYYPLLIKKKPDETKEEALNRIKENVANIEILSIEKRNYSYKTCD